MALKWTMDAAWAALAVVASICGGIYTTVYRSGASASELRAVQGHQRDQDAEISANKQEVEDFKQHEAAVEQKLDDMAATLDRIEKDLK